MQAIIAPAVMQDIDRKAIDGLGVPGIVLMENAGSALLSAVQDNYSFSASVTVICGKGNNGGDGFVLARRLSNLGKEVCIICLFEKGFLPKGDAGTNYRLSQRLGIKTYHMEDFDLFKNVLKKSCLIVDGIFGTGLNSPVKAPYSTIIDMMNFLPNPVLCIDIPSGIDGSNGQILGKAVRADMTVTFAYYKTGHFLYPGREYAGTIIKKDIGIPYYLLDPKDHINLVEVSDIRNLLRKRRSASHKGDHGHLCIIGGSRGKAGAVMMAGMAALRSGTGLLTLGVPGPIGDLVNTMLYESMVFYLMADEKGYIKGPAPSGTIMEKFSSCALGPGLGTESVTRDFLLGLLKGNKKPFIVDADALNIIAANKAEFSFLREGNIIFTPHPGELARFFDVPREIVYSDPLKYSLMLGKEFNAVVVSKGPTNLIIDRDLRIFCIPGDAPQLAKGGSGDILTGVIGALCANGYSLCDASLIGVFLHNISAKLAVKNRKINNRSLTARELIESLSDGLNYIENH